MAALTGAGISAASGVPTFRGAEGLWRNHRAEDLATPQAFDRDPRTVWEWYGWRRSKIHAARPNPAHHALSSLAHRVDEMAIITQNVDGLHPLSLQEAGVDDVVDFVELHGSLWTLRCTQCARERVDRSPGPEPGELPRCDCGGLLRPGVVWFGESLPERALAHAHRSSRLCDVFLVVGTSALVHPAAGFAAIARDAGAFVAEFNLETTPISSTLVASVLGPCEVTLPALIERLTGDSPRAGSPEKRGEEGEHA